MIESRGLYVSHKDVDTLIGKFDKNKDGRISFSEVSSLTSVQSRNAT